MKKRARWLERLACAVGLHQYGAPIVTRRARLFVRCMRCLRESPGVHTA